MQVQVAGAALQSADGSDSRVILRDGTAATVRTTVPSDLAALRRFFHELSAESHWRRFFTLADPQDALLESFCDSADPARRASLVVLRQVEGELRPIAVGSYIELGKGEAEAAFTVSDAFQGKGLGTILLERLAAMAAANGFRAFEATVLPDNAPMLEVFFESGFEIRSRSERGSITVRLSLNPTSESVTSSERRQAAATVTSMRPLLAPRSVAVIGASREPASIGARLLHAIVSGGFAGNVYPINPNATQLEGLPCYASIASAPHDVDLAIVAVPAAAVVGVVELCARAGVKALAVISAGFAEMGDVGRARQQQLIDTVRGHGLRMIGPNCMGLLCTAADLRLNASFSPIVPPAGRIALSSQSGALGLAILELASQRRLGLSAFVSVGNKADVSSNDLLEYWEADASTGVILLYLESFGNPRRFARIARRVGRKKPIVALKAGRTHAGGRAAASHTAALAASDVAVDALFHQSGVIRAETIDEMFDIAACLDLQPLPPGRRVAIVTNAGGPGILTVDACEANGLSVTPFSPETQARLRAFLPSEASVGNPVDMVASAGPDAYRQAIEATLTAPECDALVVVYTPVDPRSSPATLQAIGEGIAAARRAGATRQPVLACVMAGPERLQQLDAGGESVPTYAYPENCARALAKAVHYAEWRAQTPPLLWSFDDIHVDEAREVCRRALERHGDGWLSSDEVGAVLGAFGLPLVAGMLAHSSDEAAALAQVLDSRLPPSWRRAAYRTRPTPVRCS